MHLLLKLKIISFTSSSQSSLLLSCSFSMYCLHSLCAVRSNFRMSLNCANSLSTATLFLNKTGLQWHQFSSEVKNIVSASYPSSETICILFLLMIVSSLFVLCQNYFGFLELHFFISAGPIHVDVSHLEGLISNYLSSGRSLASS